MRKDENIEFIFANFEKDKEHRVFTFMNLENQLKLHVNQIFSDCQISKNACFHAVFSLRFLRNRNTLFKVLSILILNGRDSQN